jgi:TetR/AcrR family tetracycline transcriptional repressor
MTGMNNNDDSRVAKNLEKLERKRHIAHQRLEEARERINAKFDRKEAQLAGALNLKQEQIIEASLEQLNESGISDLSLRDIAKRLNMQAPALYWHFKNKEIMIDFMAEAILQKEFKDLHPRDDDELWQDWLMQHMIKLRKAMLAYTDGARVVAGAHIFPATTLAKSFECALISLESAGIELAKSRHIIATATHYTFGHVIEEQAAPTQERIATIDMDELRKSYPHIANILKNIEHTQESANSDFVIGLEYIIRGSGVS